jgi:hypothetical protein
MALGYLEMIELEWLSAGWTRSGWSGSQMAVRD